MMSEDGQTTIMEQCGIDLPISMTCMSLNPEKAKFFRISQPRPPAPLIVVKMMPPDI